MFTEPVDHEMKKTKETDQEAVRLLAGAKKCVLKMLVAASKQVVMCLELGRNTWLALLLYPLSRTTILVPSTSSGTPFLAQPDGTKSAIEKAMK